MIDTFLSTIAPHLCYSCGKLGALLCDNCKYDIISEDFNICILCGSLSLTNGVCKTCNPPFSRAWCVGERSDELRLLLDDYKFQRKRAAYSVLGELLFQRIGILPENCNIVAIPSNPMHIRQRGYDHTFLVAQHLAKLNNRKPERFLGRQAYSVQTGKSKRERAQQAAHAFSVRDKCDNKTVLIVDDVVTTGATLKAAASLLREAGAADVWVAVIARQPLD